MKSATQCLQPADIKALLAGIVPASQSELWEEHFSSCESCRRAMAGQVGDQEWWREAEQSLMSASIPEERDAVKSEADERESIEELLKLLGPTDDPQMLGRIGSYEVLGVLGRGGMGVVFKAFDAPLNRFVAIKMLLPHLAASGAARKRFAREGQAVAAVVDDHVMAIHCVDEWQGVPYLVMTYSRGVSLQKRLSDNGPLEVREILRIGMQAAKGLAAAHAQGIVHRDIKPANIFLDQNVERVQLMDFGLARAVDDATLTRSGTLAGTPQYMSPEQARAETVDHRSDLFSLGSVLYAMCTGHAPFRAESSYSVLRLITDKEPRPIREINSDIPEWLCAIIGKLMTKQASDRLASAQEVALLLEDCLAHVQQPTVKVLPGSLMKHLVPRSASSRPARLMQQFKRLGIRACLFAGLSVTAIMLIAMMLQDNVPQLSGQGDSGPLTVAQANLNELLQQQKAREESIRQISYKGTVRQYGKQDIQRTNTESVDEFVARCVGLVPVYMDDKVPPYPLSASRDFSTGVYRFTLGDIQAAIPEYMDWFIEKKQSLQLMGREPGACEAVITNNRKDIQDDRKASIVRLDIAAFRPVEDILMSEVVMNAVGVPGIPDVAGRPLWKLEKFDNKVGWKATFMFQQPTANPPGAKQILWYRVYWEQIGGELVIARVDKLPVIGDEHSTPESVLLIDDYRSVCGKPVPFRVRCFVLSDSFIQGAELTVSDMKVNDYVVPDQMQIPAGSPVRNHITGMESRQPASQNTDSITDAELIQGTWNVLDLQQVGRELSEFEREVYKNGGYKITFTKNKMIHSPDHSSMQYRVDTTETPRVIELSQSGNVVAKAIYELNGDELKLCEGRKTTNGDVPKAPASFDLSQAMPSEFPTLMILRRTKPIEPIAIPLIGESIATREKVTEKEPDARSVVEAYVASALAGDVAKAAALAKNSAADPKHIRELPEFLNVQRLKIETVYVNDPGKPTRALATSVTVKLDEEHKNPDGRRDGFLVFTLEFTDDKWLVIDIDFESESGAEKELKRFLEANPNSIGLPPLKSNSMPNLNPAADLSEDHDCIQGAWQSLDLKSLPAMPAGLNQLSVSFLADRMSMSGPQRAGIGIFSLSPDTVPKQIDCRLTFGETHVEFIGIYEFRDSQLWLCLTEGKQRAKSFDNPPAVAGLMTFALERKHVELPDVDSDASLALSDWSQSQDGAGVFATYTLSIPGIETISQGLAAGGPAVKEFSGVPGFPGKVFTLRYFLPKLSPRGMAFVAGTSFQSSLNLIELAQVAERKRLVKVFSYPDSATGASDPIGAVPVDRPVETPEVEPMESSLKISVLKAGADQADWLKEIDATGEIIYGYEIVVR